jgi:hypothetical protein
MRVALWLVGRALGDGGMRVGCADARKAGMCMHALVGFER